MLKLSFLGLTGLHIKLISGLIIGFVILGLAYLSWDRQEGAAKVSVVSSALFDTMSGMIQFDLHANLKVLSPGGLSFLISILKKGWYFIGLLLVKVLFLYSKVDNQALFYSTVFLFICSNFRKETRLNIAKMKSFSMILFKH